MRTHIDAASATHIDHAPDSATRWPQFTERELGRLRFLAYCWRTGRFRHPAPVSAEVEALCAALLAGPVGPEAGEPRPERPARHVAPTLGPVRHGAARGVPTTWAAWAEKYGTLRPASAGGPDRRPYPYAR